MELGTFSWLFTMIAFSALGGAIANRRLSPASPWMFVVLLLGAVVGLFVGVDTHLLSVFGFEVLLNGAIVSCCLGGCVGLLIRNRRVRGFASV